MLVARKDRLQRQNHGTISRLRALLHQRRRIALRRRQRMVISDQNRVCRSNRAPDLLGIDDGGISGEGPVKSCRYFRRLLES